MKEGVVFMNKPYISIGLSSLLNYFAILAVKFHDLPSLLGFIVFIVIGSQIVSGVMLSFSLIPEPMLIPMIRDEEDLEDLYIDDFFWLHERGVDLIFIFSYFHLFRKLFLNIFDNEHESAWKSGVFTFLMFQVVVFLGLVLCCTHLSEITLTIAANILHTFFFFYGKAYWWVFTDKQLNSDSLIRLAYAHYLSAFYLVYIALLHGIDMHYDWKTESIHDCIPTEMAWWDEVLANELGNTIDALLVLWVVTYYLYEDPEPVTYELFMWGDIGLVPDIRFYGVAPHWYFRPFMAWLIVCPHHKTGIFGLLFFFFVLFFQPTLHGLNEQNSFLKRSLNVLKFKLNKHSIPVQIVIASELSLYHNICYGFFLMCALYTSSFLPYGRFFNRLGGNSGMLGAYMFVFAYLAFIFFRRSLFLELATVLLHVRVLFLKNYSNEFLKLSRSF